MSTHDLDLIREHEKRMTTLEETIKSVLSDVKAMKWMLAALGLAYILGIDKLALGQLLLNKIISII